MLLIPLVSLALADDPPVEVRPFGYIRPGFRYLQDDPQVVSDQDGFILQGRLGLRADFPKHIRGVIEVDIFAEPSLRDAFVSWTPNDWFDLTLGQAKLPISAGELASDSRRILPIEAQAVGAIPGRELGAMASVHLPVADEQRVTFTTSMTNGEGTNRSQNVNQRFQHVQRLLVTPFGTRAAQEGTAGELYLGLGGAWLYNYQGEGETAEEINYLQAELQLAWKGLSVQGEYLRGTHAFANAAVQDYGLSGWYAHAGGFLPVPWAEDHLELVARVGQFDPNDQLASDQSLQFLPSTLEAGGGVNLYARELPRQIQDLKLQLQYVHYEELEGQDLDNDQFLGQATVRF